MSEELNSEVQTEVLNEPSPAEAKAMERGWVPKDVWEADEKNAGKKWRDAEEFNDRGELFEKIEELGFDSSIDGNNSDGGYLCSFTDLDNNEICCIVKIIYDEENVSKLNTVWLAVVKFIKWYNENQKTK